METLKNNAIEQRESESRREPGLLTKEEAGRLRNLLAILANGAVAVVGSEAISKLPEHAYATGHFAEVPAERPDLKAAIEALTGDTIVKTSETEIFTTAPPVEPESTPLGIEKPTDQAPVSSVRPEVRPEYVVTYDQSLYESVPDDSENLLKAVEQHRQFISMNDGVLFTDSEGKVVASLDVTIIDGINPGRGFTETGHVSEGYDSAWRDTALEVVERTTGVPADSLGTSFNWLELQSAAADMGSHPNSVIEVVEHYSSEVLENGQTKLEYLQDHLEIVNEAMPETLRAAVRTLALGIPGEETRFKPDVVSPVGATTTFQFMHATWEGLGYPPFETFPNGEPPYELTVEAFGRYLGVIYNELMNEETSASLERVTALFSSEEAFHEQFLAVVIVNAYNAGPGTMRAAINAFVESDEFRLLESDVEVAGYDVFYTLSRYAHQNNEGALAYYKDDAMNYPTKVIAYSTYVQPESEELVAFLELHQTEN